MVARRPIILAVIAACAALGLHARITLAQNGANSAQRLEARRFDELRAAGQFAEAETYCKQLIEKYRSAGDGRKQYFYLSMLVDLYIQLERTPEALPLAKEALAGCKQHYGPRHSVTGDTTHRLGRVYLQLNRTDEALALYQQARDILVAADGNNSSDVNYVDGLIASALAHLGRYQESERIRLRTLAWERRDSGGRPTAGVSIELHNLGELYHGQGRHKDAEPLLREACEILVKAGQGRSVYHANSLKTLGDIYKAMHRHPSAVKCYQQAYALYADLLGKDHPLAVMQSDLADVYTSMEKYDEAEAIFDKSLECALKYYGPESSQVYDTRHAMVSLYALQGKKEKAEQLAQELLKFVDQPHLPRGALRNALTMCQIIARSQGKFEVAARYGARSIEIEEQERATLSGGELQQAQTAAVRHMNYSLTAVDYFRSRDIPKGFAVLEQGRGRTLLDQMTLGRVDLFAGMPAEQAQRLRAAYDAIETQTSDLERRITAVNADRNLSEPDRKQQLARLGAELQASRQQQTEAYAYIRNESPAFRRVIGETFSGVSLDEVKAYVKREQALLLYYVVGPDVITLLMCDGGEDIGLARCLPPGFDKSDEYGGSHIEPLLYNAKGSGVLQLLADPTSEKTLTPKLAELAKIVFPEFVLNYLRAHDIKRLIIVPDGALAMLPFEALVIEQEPEVKYFLDIAPPINYAPSMTILMNLQQRAAPPIPADREPVLTVGDPAYGPPTSASSPTTQVAAVDRAYRQRGGGLSRLPFSGLEAGWVAETFNKHEQKAALLRDRAATEAAVRAAAPNRRIVHLACHGLADDVTDNFFAALALAPGSATQANPRDDGFLTLSELYDLDLRACELAILSACQTNYGPQHDGEGVWALSRSFLVAGARRVVASNWLVDDKAGASLISYFCGAIVKQPTDEADYARALTDAKRWIRGQGQWKHPYYWATFVLIGPR